MQNGSALMNYGSRYRFIYSSGSKRTLSSKKAHGSLRITDKKKFEYLKALSYQSTFN